MKKFFIWLAKLAVFLVVILIVVPVALVAGFIALEKAIAPSMPKSDKLVSVVEIKGAIVDSKKVIQELYRQVDNKSVKGIVLRIDSPGGSVGPSQDIYEAVMTLKEKKPIVASMGGIAASGGLYAAVGASKVYAQPGTLTGSLGVILQIPNFTDIASKVGFEMVTVKSGKWKDIGNSFRKMTPEEKQFLDENITLALQHFIQAVSEGRGLDIEDVRKFADGRILLGTQGKELGLVDEYGGVHAAARAVFELLGTPLKDDEDPKLYYPQDKFEQFRKIVEGAHSFFRMFSTAPRLEYMVAPQFG